MKLLKQFCLIIPFLAMPCAIADVNDWNIDPIHSSIDFTVDHMMISKVHGSFKKLSGNVKYDGKDLKGSKINTAIEVTSIDTHDSDRDKHLLSPDFFDAPKYPTMSFVSKKIIADKDHNFQIIGDLTLHGVTKEVTLNCNEPSSIITDPWGNKRFGVEAKGKINRKDFGMSFNKTLDQGQVVVGDEINISINAEMVQKKAKS